MVRGGPRPGIGGALPIVRDLLGELVRDARRGTRWWVGPQRRLLWRLLRTRHYLVAPRLRQRLAPELGLFEFYERALAHTKDMQRALGIRRAARQGDAARLLEGVAMTMEGAEAVSHELSSGRPVVLIRWHHSNPLEEYYLKRAFPRLILANRHVSDWGDFQTIGLENDAGLGLARIIHQVRKGGAVAMGFDGLLGRRDLEKPYLGFRQAFAVGVFHTLRMTGATGFPVTSFLQAPDTLQIIIGRPLIAGDQVLADDGVLLETCICYFEEMLRREDPTHVDLNRMLKLATA